MKRRPHLPFRIPFFRIFYSTTYTTLFILTLILLAITPAALIYTALEATAYQYVFEIGGVYVLVAILTLFIYSSRLYTNRAVLAAVGKSWIPVQKGEVSHNVRKMIVKASNRSAIIAFESRPRNLQNDLARLNSHRNQTPATVGKIVQVDPQHPPWGRIAHAGWSSPSNLDTNLAPHIQFRTVVHELPNLVEARAVSLAPPDPSYAASNMDGTAPADINVVSLLQRSPTADMRTYLGHLSHLGLVNPPEAGEDFVRRYEHARFSPIPVSESEFQALMAAFANLLTGMDQLPPRLLDLAKNRPTTPSSGRSGSSRLSSSPSSRSTSIASSIAGSVVRPRLASSRVPSFYTPRASIYSARTASPTTRRKLSYSTPRPQTSQTGNTIFRTPSQHTFGSVGSVIRTVPREESESLSSSSSSSSSTASVRRAPSFGSQKSVIRLAPSPGPGRLPYEWTGDGG